VPNHQLEHLPVVGVQATGRGLHQVAHVGRADGGGFALGGGRAHLAHLVEG
jgi:hypothetical protein